MLDLLTDTEKNKVLKKISKKCYSKCGKIYHKYVFSIIINYIVIFDGESIVGANEKYHFCGCTCSE